MQSPAQYDAWYDTSRGRWISDCEFNLMMSMMQPVVGDTLLDVGCGTGHFSRRFAETGLQVTGVDPDDVALDFARSQDGNIAYRDGDAMSLPFDNNAFDYCTAVTSLCFVSDPEKALRDMWRVCRKGVMLGLLNSNSRLYRERERHPGYAGARWDSVRDIRAWTTTLDQQPERMRFATAVNYPSGTVFSRIMEKLIPAASPRGSFLAVYLSKSL